MAPTSNRITIAIDEELCKGCGLCFEVCPRKAISFAPGINARGFHPASVTDADECTGCAQCAIMCPDACIKIVRSE